MRVRRAAIEDLDRLCALRAALWPETTADEHRLELRSALAGPRRGALPQATFVTELEGRLVGFVEVAMRSHADGCDPSRPCGFLEGWFVEPGHRRRGVGRALVGAAVDWCRENGCLEIASDTWIDSESSQRAHEALGFEVVDRCVNYRKRIATPPPEPPADAHYGSELARIHHAHFGAVARAAARELTSRLSRGGFRSGTVVDLAAGTGTLAHHLTEAGFEIWGVDLSEDMLRIARAWAKTARFVHGSLWSEPLPRCVGVAAVGEAFCYAADPAAGLFALGARLQAIHEALDRGGVLLFDVAGPGRSGPTGTRHAFWNHEDSALGLEENEDSGFSLTRTITVFARRGALFERSQEIHRLHLYGPEVVQGLLERAGFAVEHLDGYDGLEEVGPGWHAFAATKR